jgi:hypothetical protein
MSGVEAVQLPPVVVAGVVGGLVAAAAWCLSRAARRGPSHATRLDARATTVDRSRLAVALAVGFLVMVATRLVALGAAAAATVWWWKRIGRDRAAEVERRRVEAVARWLDDLRDALRGSSVSAEEALDEVASRPPDALVESCATFQRRRRQGVRVEAALDELADDIAHPVADAAIVAIQMVIGGSSGGARLHPTVSALAAAARDEVRARERVDRARSVYRSSMVRLVVVAIVLVGFLRFAGGDLLDPYGTPTGQVVLLVPIGMWAGCVWWLDRLCAYEPAPRRPLAVRSLAADAAEVPS